MKEQMLFQTQVFNYIPTRIKIVHEELDNKDFPRIDNIKILQKDTQPTPIFPPKIKKIGLIEVSSQLMALMIIHKSCTKKETKRERNSSNIN